MASAPKRLGRAIGSPVRRYFEPRFLTVEGRIRELMDELATARKEIVRAERETMTTRDALRDLLSDESEASAETARLVGAYLNEIRASLDDIESAMTSGLRRLATGSVTDVSEDVAAVLNRSLAPDGFAAERGLWFNPPAWVVYQPGDVRLGGVNERIGEVPYVFRAMAAVPYGARVLDVGGAEATVGTSLGTLGFRVTVVDPRSVSVPHPNVEHVASYIEDFETDEPFDASICLSTIEHIGIGHYGLRPGDDDDIKAMERVRDVTKTGGLLLLTVPYGEARVDDLQRTYDADRLGLLLRGWEVTERRFLARRDGFTWEATDDPSPLGDDASVTKVALVTARKSG